MTSYALNHFLYNSICLYCVLFTVCVYGFSVILRINSGYFWQYR